MNNETKKDITPEQREATLDNVVSREIVQEILRYGVTQDQILKIIEILAMELENRETMIAIVECINTDHETTKPKSGGLITDI
tara:strand:+ start:81 stop:329 length:249 start_codon:yes stop_codon:yes gene_type:complete